jgi:DNA-binding CsgD family transcriptional regulator
LIHLKLNEKEEFKFEAITPNDFYEYWDINKTNSNKKTSEIINFFKPYVDTIPKLALGEYYWQIFNNAQPVPKVLLVGGDVEKLTPTTADGLMRTNFKEFFTFFHPDDLQQALTYVAKIFEMLFALTPEKRENYNFTIYTRIRNGEGQYLWNSLQYPALYFDENDKYLFGLALYTNVHHLMKPDAVPMLTILDSSQKTQQIFTCYSPNNQVGMVKKYPNISKREREVIALLSQGKASKQISDILGISKNTVDNHRQRLLKKFGVTSSAELVIKAYLV